MGEKVTRDIHWTESFKNIATALAVVIGGLWALLKYDSLLEEEIAKAQFANLQRKSLALKIDAVQLNDPATTAKGIFSTVVLKNDGDLLVNLEISGERSERFDQSIGPLVVSRLDFSTEPPTVTNTYRSYRYTVASGELGTWATQQVQPQSTKIVTFYTEVDESGIYLVEFLSPSGKTRGAWNTSTYVRIE